MARKIKKSDMAIFIEKFQPSKYKELKNGIEVRSSHNVDVEQSKASSLINSLSLGLVVVREANAACMGAFEVKELDLSIVTP